MAEILIINDERFICMMLQHILESGGFKVDVANMAQEGIDKAQEKAYDLILIDFHMPEMNGDEACKILRKHKATSKVPIYILSATGVEQAEKIVKEACVNGYLDLSLDEDELCRQIQGILDQQNM